MNFFRAMKDSIILHKCFDLRAGHSLTNTIFEKIGLTTVKAEADSGLIILALTPVTTATQFYLQISIKLSGVCSFSLE